MLNPRVRQALGWLAEHQPATGREFQDAGGWSSTATCFAHLHQLARQGVVTMVPRVPRTLLLAEGVVASRSGRYVGRLRMLEDSDGA